MIRSFRIALLHLGLVAVAGSTASLAAQQTLVVGAGGTFPTIAAAITAASPGDTVLVNGGSWTENLTIDKGIALIGRSARLEQGVLLQPLRIRDVPLGESVTVAGFTPQSGSFALDRQVEVLDCAGAVHLHDLGQSGLRIWRLTARNSAQVHVSSSIFRTALLENCNTTIESCVFDPESFWSLTVRGGRAAVVGSSLRGGVSVLASNAISLTHGELAIADSTVRATGQNNPAIATIGGAVLVDPSAVLQPTGAAPAVSGTATVVPFEFGFQRARTDGTTLTMVAAGPAGAPFLTLIGLPAPLQPTNAGWAWLDPTATAVVAAGTFPATGTHTSTLLHPSLPPGTTAVLQTALLGSAGVSLSTPAVAVAP